MALPDYFKIEPGTAIIWGEAGASGVTNTLSLDGLAAGSGRMGAYADLGAQFDQEYMVLLAIESGTASTVGLGVQLYLPCTHSTSYWPGGVTGSDAAWPTDGDEDEWALQLGPPVVTLYATNDADTLHVQQAVIWRPCGRYVTAVVDNNWSTAFRDKATASNNDSRVILVPLRSLVQDAA